MGVENKWILWKGLLARRRSGLRALARNCSKGSVEYVSLRSIYENQIEEIEKYLHRLNQLGAKPTAHGYGIRFTEYQKILKLWNIKKLEDRELLEEISRKRVAPLTYRMKGVIEWVYDFGGNEELIKSYERLASSRRPVSKDFPLFEFLFAYFPKLFFKGKEVGGVLDINSSKMLQHWRFLQELTRYIDAFNAYHDFLYWSAHDSKKWYRDHILHSIRVMWLMKKFYQKWYKLYLRSVKMRLKKLLEECGLEQKKINKIFGRLHRRHGFSSGRFLCRDNAMLAGLFHDLFSPFQNILRGQRLRFLKKRYAQELLEVSRVAVPHMEAQFLLGNLKLALKPYMDFRTLEDVYKERKETVSSNLLPRLLRKGNHGVFGSVLLRGLPIEARQAIALHDQHDTNIDILKMPVSFFLVLADEAQERGRLLLCDDRENYIVPCDDVEAEINHGFFSVTIDFTKKISKVSKCKKDFSIDEIMEKKYEKLSILRADQVLGVNIEFHIVCGREQHFIKFVSGNWKPCKCHAGLSGKR